MVLKRFELFHLSLVAREAHLFQTKLTREETIRKAFGNKATFLHRKKEYFWVPAPADHSIIGGTIVRRTVRKQHLPPSQGAEEIVGAEWQGAIVAIDPSHHDDGQKLAFERDVTVGRPASVLDSLVQYLNQNTIADSPFVIQQKQIFDSSDFWEWAKIYNNRVKKISFDLVVPNMWDISGDFDKDIRDLGAVTGTQRMKTVLSSSDGVRVNTKPVEDGIAYSARGGGDVTAVSQDGETYSSIRRPKITEVDIPPDTAKSIWDSVIAKIKRVLGRE